jgi:hypothetical protein
MNTNSQIKIIVGLTLLLLVAAVLFYLVYTQKWKKVPFLKNPVIVNEKITIPETKDVHLTDGYYANKQGYQVPLAPSDDGEKVVVTGATHSPYTSYDLVNVEALAWADDARLALIKSLGTVTLEGTSSGWQIIYVSLKKKSGYEIIVEGGAVVQKKEIPTSAKGGAVPENFKERDASWAIARLTENPQWKDATMTGLNFTYNTDARAWDYVIANSYGGSSIRVR